MKNHSRLALSIAFLLLLPHLLPAQTGTTTVRDSALRIYLECSACDDDYTRQEMPFVNVVRDRGYAQVDVMSTSESTVSGGRLHTFWLTGREEFAGVNDTIRFLVPVTATEVEGREMIVDHLKRGLIRYLIHTPLADRIEIGYRKPASEEENEVNDSWHHWVITPRLGGSVDIKSASRNIDVIGAVGVAKITKDWTVSLTPQFRYYQYFDNDTRGMDYSSSYRSEEIYATVARGIGRHFSVGTDVRGYASQSSSQYASQSSTDNHVQNLCLAPAIEYSLFPYEESVRRRIVVYYGSVLNWYWVNKPELREGRRDFIPEHQLGLAFSTYQTWGGAYGGIGVNQDLTYPSIYGLSLRGSFDIRLVRGLYFQINNYLSTQRDVFGDLQPDPSQLEDLSTDVFYTAGFGLSYTFGSIFDHEVNRRFRW